MEEVESKLGFDGWLHCGQIKDQNPMLWADKRSESYILGGENSYPQGPDAGR